MLTEVELELALNTPAKVYYLSDSDFRFETRLSGYVIEYYINPNQIFYNDNVSG